MEKLIVVPTPHIRSKNTTDRIMARVIIALLPTLAMAVFVFGVRALTLSIVCILACMLFEVLFRRIIKKDKGIDLSPAVTGLILAFCLPVTFPFFYAIIGCFIAIVVVKQLFGGLGQNFANPAATARIVLFLSFPVHMTTWVVPFYYTGDTDAITSATPLAIDVAAGEEFPEMLRMFFGVHGGSIGETCALALILGFVYLVLTKVIRPVIPVAYVTTVALGAFVAGEDVLFQILAGGLLFGAIYMATDYATTPVSMSGKLVFGIGCGFITLAIRFFADMPEGVSFAILIMNILTYYIDKFTTPKPFGASRETFSAFKKKGDEKNE